MTRARVRPFATREKSRERVRASASTVSDPVTGAGEMDVYNVPAGYQFEIRRIQWDLWQIVENGNNLNNNGASGFSANSFIRYLRSGTFMCYGRPANIPGLTPWSIPGVESWGEEEGPKLTSGETFQVRFRNTQATFRGAGVTVTVEGILSEVGSLK